MMMKSTAIVLVLAGVCLTACAESAKPRMEAVTPTEQFAIEVQSEPVTLQLAPHQSGASRRQADALAALADRWSDQGGGEIVIQTPVRDGDPAAAYRTASDARDILLSRGIPAGKLRMASYTAPESSLPTILVTYPRYKAEGPACGRAWGNLTANHDNRPYNNFGCSVTANVAAQIDNPADLLSPRDLDPPDATRRQNTLDGYRKGGVTSTLKDVQASGAVSSVVP
jgi:pilus assembly protein CpaD